MKNSKKVTKKSNKKNKMKVKVNKQRCVMDNQINENVREEKKEHKLKMLKIIFIVSTILLIICFLL